MGRWPGIISLTEGAGIEIVEGCWERGETCHLEVGDENDTPESFHRKGEMQSEFYKIRTNISSTLG